MHSSSHSLNNIPLNLSGTTDLSLDRSDSMMVNVIVSILIRRPVRDWLSWVADLYLDCDEAVICHCLVVLKEIVTQATHNSVDVTNEQA